MASVYMRMLVHTCEATTSLSGTNVKNGEKWYPTLPGNLRGFFERAPESWRSTNEEILTKYTLLPFFLPFLSVDEKDPYLEWTLVGKLLRSHHSLTKSQDIPKYFRGCPTCVREDLNAFEEPYFRTFHHIPHLNFCIYHKERLAKVGTYYTPIKRIFEDLHNLCSLDDEKSEIEDDLRLYLIGGFTFLAGTPSLLSEKHDFQLLYFLRMRLLEMDLPELISRCQQGTSDLFSKVTFKRLSWKSLRLLPIHHLIIQYNLGLTTEEAFAHSNGRFWKCPNPLTDCGITVTKRLTRKCGIVHCQHCGLEAMLSMNTPLGQKTRWITLIKPPETLVEYIRNSLTHGKPLLWIAKELNLYPERISLMVSGSKQSERVEKDRSMHRNILENILTNEPNLSRTKFREHHNKSYGWLLRNDREWLWSKIGSQKYLGGLASSKSRKV